MSEIQKKNNQEQTSLPDLDELLKKTSTQGSRLFLFVLAFLIGILVSFTPCVYPLIPITVGILRTHASSSLFSHFIAASSYVAGISLVYATLGYVVSKTSLIFGQWLANPWVIGFIMLFLLYLAFALFGFYELYIPNFLKQGATLSLTKASFIRIFIFGVISGFVASPCLTPGLAGILAIVAQEKNPLIGFLIMLFFSLGMSILLLVIGTFSNALSLLPRTGAWMVEVERMLGFFMLALCAYYLNPLINSTLAFALYSIIAGIALLYYLIRLYSFMRSQ